jgi:hypothetical protein
MVIIPSDISVIRGQLDRCSWRSRVRLVLRRECISTILRGVASRDVMSLRRWASEGIASWDSCVSWFLAMGTRSGTYIPVASSVNCAVPIISSGVWNWSVVSKQADASKIIPFPCSVFVEAVEVLLVWQRKVVS